MTASKALNAGHRTQQPPAPTASPIVDAASRAASDGGRALFDLLRQKWKEVPAGLVDRVDTGKVLTLSDWELRDYWEGVWHESTTGPAFAVRGWYQEMYREIFRGKRVLEIGSGCGIDGIDFVRNGATWHFADIVPGNLKLIRRLLDAFGLDCEGMTYIEDLGSLDRIPGGFDFIYCQGSMINVPFDFARRETLHLLPHLRPGGRWVELCYPRERWAREGKLPFAEWGRLTDGDATPWMEWYDLDRLRQRFAPVALNPLLAFDFYNDDFNWFDFRIDAVPDRNQIASHLTAGASNRLQITLAPSNFKIHRGGKIDSIATGAGPAVRIQTPPQIWSYAVHGTLSAQTMRQAAADPATGQIVPAVEILVSVQQGRVGVAIMSDGLADFIAPERHLPQRKEPYLVKLLCPHGYERYHVLVRNTQGGDQPSICTIHQMALGCVRPDDLVDAIDVPGGNAPVIALTALVRRHLPAIKSDNASAEIGAADLPVFVRAVAIDDLDRALGFAEPSRTIATDRAKSFRAWTMEVDDAPILAYLYRNHRPRRHLEFGTWEGFGATLCATNSEAEIWTLNLPDGERDAIGAPAYSSALSNAAERPEGAQPLSIDQAQRAYFQTDAGAFIGRRYRQAGLQNRVHQVLADSREWDSSTFGPGFFDSVLIDGGHQTDVVLNDTEKSLPLLRDGGLMLWHDFCPTDGPMADFAATRGVVCGIHQGWRRWSSQFEKIFWVRPSFLLVGIKRGS